MRSFAVPLLLAAFASAPALAQTSSAPPPAPLPDLLKTQQAQDSYVIGQQIGQQLRGQGIEIDDKALMKGVDDALASAPPLLTDQQMQNVTEHLHEAVVARHEEQLAQAAAANKAAGEVFLKANAARPGVITLPSGLQYEVLRAGTGPIPKGADVVLCNYRGVLINGTEFDSNYGRNAPARFRVDGVIKGWTEALEHMPVGSKWRIVLPPDLAYGDKGAGLAVGPNSVLIFDVELLSIQGG
jgi:FKBP-type peptidyl-prolyl cis-trans isomerase FklB